MLRLRILLLGDNPLAAQAACLQLKPHDVIHVMTGPEALELACDEDFDGILVDVGMPGMSGPDFIAALHARRPEVAARAVLLTGMTRFDDQKAAAPLIWKPLTREDAERLYWWWTGGDDP